MKQQQTKMLLEAYYFVMHGKDMPQLSDDPALRDLEEIAKRLPIQLINRLESIFDHITDHRPFRE